MNQSKLIVNTSSWREAQENVHQRAMVLFYSTSSKSGTNLANREG